MSIRPQDPFAKLATWLDDNLEKYGFYRPYLEYKGGVAPEPWHISHIGAAAKMMQYLSVATLQQCIEQSELSGKQAILAELNTLYERYVLNVNKP